MDPLDQSDSDDVLSQLSPQELRQLLSLGVAPDQQQQLQQQLLQAQTLRAGSSESHHTSPLGALFHGLAGGIQSFAGGMRENQVAKQLQGLQGQQVDARQLLLSKLLRRRQPEPSAAGAGDVMPSDTFGLG